MEEKGRNEKIKYLILAGYSLTLRRIALRS
jgi:hypothetical protein